MAEFESERRMRAAADAVFGVVSDLDRLPEWMPASVGVRATGDAEVHADVEPRDVHAHGLVRIRPDQLRIEWGGDADPDYTGWLQVMHADEGRSSVVLHLSFLGHQPETHAGREADEVRAWMDDALDRLAGIVT
jgi:uncharacterized protein YndB with AHSA1/START domain